MSRILRLLLLTPLVACERPFSFPAPAATISVTPATIDLYQDDSVQLSAVVRDSAGQTLADRPVFWSSSDPARVHITDAGLAIGLASGPATITARAEAVSGTASIHVTIRIGSVTIDQGDLSVVPGATLRLSATPFSRTGDPLGGHAISWTSADTALVQVAPDGGLIARREGATTVTVTVEGVSASIGIRVERLTFTAVSAGEFRHTCGRVADGRVFCWGQNSLGQLGVAALSLATSPVATKGAPRLAAVTAGAAFTCGLGDTGVVYCWGSAARGRLGTGATANTPHPALVPVTEPLRTLSSGWNHTCGVGGDGRGTCWGEFPQVGNYPSPVAHTPVSVLGEVNYVAIAAGEGFSCGLGTDSLAYCWGTNFSERLGDDTVPLSVTPLPVSGGRHFATISAGGLHACGLMASGAAFCWGDNASGQLGAGSAAPAGAAIPQPVVGGLVFTAIAAGSRATCALTPAGEAYCWGSNDGGQLGSNAADVCTGLPCNRAPLAVAGGLQFTQISVGDQHSCGLSVPGILYCWGKNDTGQMGDGTLTDRPAPAPVAGQR